MALGASSSSTAFSCSRRRRLCCAAVRGGPADALASPRWASGAAAAAPLPSLVVCATESCTDSSRSFSDVFICFRKPHLCGTVAASCNSSSGMPLRKPSASVNPPAAASQKGALGAALTCSTWLPACGRSTGPRIWQSSAWPPCPTGPRTGSCARGGARRGTRGRGRSSPPRLSPLHQHRVRRSAGQHTAEGKRTDDVVRRQLGSALCAGPVG